jgi:hypothetical protein
MDSYKFVDSLVNEIVKPGLQSLMETQYFTELRKRERRSTRTSLNLSQTVPP